MSSEEEKVDVKYVEKLADDKSRDWIEIAQKTATTRGTVPREKGKIEKTRAPKKKVSVELKGNKFNPYDINQRHFQLTLFGGAQVYNQVKEYLTGRKAIIYFFSCREICPETGNEHYHIYVHFKTSVKLSKNKCHHAHLEPCRGNITQNCNYISKTGSPELIKKGIDSQNVIVDEMGSRPHCDGGRIHPEDLKTMTDEQIVMVDPRCHGAYIKARNILVNPNDITVSQWRKTVKVFYIQGPSGSWKTSNAIDIILALGEDTKFNSVKCENGFWLGVGNAKIAIYDEFRSSDMRAKEFINFIDYNKHIMNIKGQEKRNEYELIIITSVEKLSDIYSSMKGEPRLQWERRVTLIDKYNDTCIDNNVNTIQTPTPSLGANM